MNFLLFLQMTKNVIGWASKRHRLKMLMTQSILHGLTTPTRNIINRRKDFNGMLMTFLVLQNFAHVLVSTLLVQFQCGVYNVKSSTLQSANNKVTEMPCFKIFSVAQ